MINSFHTLSHTLLILGGAGFICATILYLVAWRFQVNEDPRIDQIDSILPQANCGGCGFAGCRNFAKACTTTGSLSQLNCPVGGSSVMESIAEIVGKKAGSAIPQIAVIRCQADGNTLSPATRYDGVRTCAAESVLYAGENGCPYSCLRHADCATACAFGAIALNPVTGRPEIDEARCTGCGACRDRCPRSVIALQKRRDSPSPVCIRCLNRDKGAVARKICRTACIGCAKCQKSCPQQAISVVNHLAQIDDNRCTACGICLLECPTGAIQRLKEPTEEEKNKEKGTALC